MRLDNLHIHSRGFLAEKLALLYFLCQGFFPAARPKRALAQTDLLLQRGSLLLLVEVKFRQSEDRGHMALGPKQTARLAREARQAAARNPACAVRGDVVLVFPHWPFVRHIQGAISLT